MKNSINRDRRLYSHFAIYAAALATGAAVESANAAVIYSPILNFSIPVTNAGHYLNVETGIGGAYASGIAGWDVNLFGNSTTALSLYAASGTGYMRNPNAGFASAATRLDEGTVVGSTAYFYGGTSAVIGSATGQWAANSTGYLGFKFKTADNLTHYGWMKLAFGANAGTRSIVQYAWEDVANTSITIPAPGAMALLGLAGFAKRRRRA